MKLNPREFEKLIDEESEDFEIEIDKGKVEEKIRHLHAQEKRADQSIYGNHDPKRKVKRR